MNFKLIVSRLKKTFAFMAVAGSFIPFSTHAQQAPKPVGPVPNARQIEWYHREIIAFFHFGMNTFTNDNEGDGKANAQLFNPTSLNCKQWTSVLKKAGIPCAI